MKQLVRVLAWATKRVLVCLAARRVGLVFDDFDALAAASLTLYIMLVPETKKND